MQVDLLMTAIILIIIEKKPKIKTEKTRVDFFRQGILLHSE